MGRQSEAIVNHFSHPHPLHLTNPQPSRSCSACNHALGTEPFYTCKAPSCTNFALHVKCTQLPYRITHPCHHHHHNQPLSLLARAHKPNGVFACRACGKHGDGFAYSCNDCDINIHVGCATLPLVVSNGSHAHQLKLEFSPPYGSNAFSCDICGVIGASNCWLYRCVPCGYDAHVSCATSKKQVVAQSSRSVAPVQNSYPNQFNNANNQTLQPVMGNAGAASSNLTNMLLQQMIGGGGGGNPLLQMLGGGGGDPLSQLMGGGGGSNPLLQMMGGGGGDLGQGLGGLDFSSVLGGIGDIGGSMGGLGDFGF